jgi:hypothetical protein
MSYLIVRFREKLSKNFSSIGEVRNIIGDKEGVLVAHILLFICSKDYDPIDHWSTEVGNFIFVPKISSLSKNFVKNLYKKTPRNTFTVFRDGIFFSRGTTRIEKPSGCS